MKISPLWIWQSLSHLKMMHEETVYSNLEFSAIKCARFLINHVSSGQFIQVDERGIMLGEVHTSFFGNDASANDILIYVRAEYRRNGVAENSINSFFSWAESHKAKLIIISQSTGSKGKEFKSLINKLELQPLGAVYGRLSCAVGK